MIQPSRRPLIACLCLVAVCASGCTNLLLQKYRNDDLLRSYHYALREKYVQVDGLKLCYQDIGPTQPASPVETVLVLPGLGTSIDFWQKNIPALAEHYRVLALDPPGFGKSEKPDATYEMPWIAERVEGFLDALRVERVSIIGGSMGGQLALLLALNHPDRVDKLIIMGSVGAWEKPGPIFDISIRLWWNDLIITDHLRRNWPNIYRLLNQHPTPLTQALLAYQMAARADGARYWPEGRASARTLKSILLIGGRERLHEVKAPTLIVFGHEDQVHNWRAGREFRERIPDSRLVIVENSGHEVMLDQPDFFNRLVLQFLKSGTSEVKNVEPHP